MCWYVPAYGVCRSWMPSQSSSILLISIPCDPPTVYSCCITHNTSHATKFRYREGTCVSSPTVVYHNMLCYGVCLVYLGEGEVRVRVDNARHNVLLECNLQVVGRHLKMEWNQMCMLFGHTGECGSAHCVNSLHIQHQTSNRHTAPIRTCIVLLLLLLTHCD